MIKPALSLKVEYCSSGFLNSKPMNKQLKKIISSKSLAQPALMALILAAALNPGTPWR